MPPRDAHRLAGISGHSSPQPEADTPMVWLDGWAKVRGGHGECARSIKAEIAHIEMLRLQYVDRLEEIERLRAALRAVRAWSSTDPAWAAQIISDALREGT